jgi:hypothetical protein
MLGVCFTTCGSRAGHPRARFRSRCLSLPAARGVLQRYATTAHPAVPVVPWVLLSAASAAVCHSCCSSWPPAPWCQQRQHTPLLLYDPMPHPGTHLRPPCVACGHVSLQLKLLRRHAIALPQAGEGQGCRPVGAMAAQPSLVRGVEADGCCYAGQLLLSQLCGLQWGDVTNMG